MSVDLSAHDNGRTVSVKPGTAIVITLASNLSTGYAWKFLSTSGRVVRLVSHRYVPPRVSRPGAGGKEIWRFAAGTRGVVGLSLGYLRSFQPKSVVQRFRVLIRVT